MGVLATVLQLLPFALDVVNGVEKLFGGGNGAQKKQAAVAMASDGMNIWGTLTSQTTSTSPVMADIEVLIEAAVRLMNDLGVFKHSTPKPAA